MATNKFIPNYTNRSEDRRTREVITNTDWNELWNLNSAQGDHSEKYLLDFTKYLIGSNGFDDTIANKVGTLDSDKEDKSTANLLCASIEYNSATGVMIFKNRNSAEMARIDLNIEKIPVRVEVKWLDNSTTPPIVPPEVPGWYLRIINTDGTDTRCIVSNLFNPITFTEDAQHIVHFDVTTASDGTKTVKATISQGTITADHLSSELKSSIEAAKDYSEISEAYAKGTVNGVEVSEGETGYHDNALYYKDLAEDAQTAAETAQSLAEDAKDDAESAKGAAQQQAGIATTQAEYASNSASAANADKYVSEGWARGTRDGIAITDPTSPYYQKNAKYYAEHAAPESNMNVMDYDSERTVKNAGGIPTYVGMQVQDKSDKSVVLTGTLDADDWSSNAQTLTISGLATSGYTYTVAPDSSDFTKWAEAVIYADDVTTANQITFHCTETPTEDIDVVIVKIQTA